VPSSEAALRLAILDLLAFITVTPSRMTRLGRDLLNNHDSAVFADWRCTHASHELHQAKTDRGPSTAFVDDRDRVRLSRLPGERGVAVPRLEPPGNHLEEFMPELTERERIR